MNLITILGFSTFSRATYSTRTVVFRSFLRRFNLLGIIRVSDPIYAAAVLFCCCMSYIMCSHTIYSYFNSRIFIFTLLSARHWTLWTSCSCIMYSVEWRRHNKIRISLLFISILSYFTYNFMLRPLKKISCIATRKLELKPRMFSSKPESHTTRSFQWVFVFFVQTRTRPWDKYRKLEVVV